MSWYGIKATLALILACCFWALLPGCGEDVTTTYSAPAQRVSGTVFLPDGAAAEVQPTLLQRLVALAGDEAFALTGLVQAAPANIQVTLVVLDGQGAQQRTAGSAVTDSHGQFVIPLPAGASVDTCRLMLVADSTRAFVYTALANDIDYATDATVSLIVQRVAQGGDLCRYSGADIARVLSAVRSLPGTVSGFSTKEMNAAALAVGATDPGVQQAVNAPFAPPPTRPPKATSTPVTPHPTPVPTLTPVPSTPAFTATRAPTEIVTATPVPTDTAAPTATSPQASGTNTPPATATAVPTGTPAPTSTPVPTATSANTPTATATSASSPGSELGNRTFTVGPASAYYSSFLPTISAGKPTGSMILAAGGTDANGHATVTVTGPAYITIPIQLAGLTVCSKIDSCTGDLYCNGGANVDETETLDSLRAGLTCVQDGTNNCPNASTSKCCSNACEGVGIGSGNPVISAVGVNPTTDSGAGALLITCMQRNITINKSSGVDCTTQDYSAARLFPQVYTSASSTAQVMNHCPGLAVGNKADVIPRFTKSGQNFDCSNWTSATGPGGFAFATPAEQPSALTVGDGAQAGILMGH